MKRKFFAIFKEIDKSIWRRMTDMTKILNTHDWCNDKLYEWGLETLEGKTLVASNRQDFFSYTELWLISIVFPKGRKEDVKNWTRDFVHNNSASHINSYAQKHVFNSTKEQKKLFFSTVWFSSTPSYSPNWSVGCSVYNEKPYSQWKL